MTNRLLMVALGGCGVGIPDGVCTEIGCTDGVMLAFTLSEPGLYQITATTVPASGSVTCTSSLPLDDTGGCTGPGFVTQSGSALPPDQQSIGDLLLTSTDLTSIHLTITRDGDPIVDQTYTPAYDELQPNGPDCEPTCLYQGIDVTIE